MLAETIGLKQEGRIFQRHVIRVQPQRFFKRRQHDGESLQLIAPEIKPGRFRDSGHVDKPRVGEQIVEMRHDIRGQVFGANIKDLPAQVSQPLCGIVSTIVGADLDRQNTASDLPQDPQGDVQRREILPVRGFRK